MNILGKGVLSLFLSRECHVHYKDTISVGASNPMIILINDTLISVGVFTKTGMHVS